MLTELTNSGLTLFKCGGRKMMPDRNTVYTEEWRKGLLSRVWDGHRFLIQVIAPLKHPVCAFMFNSHYLYILKNLKQGALYRQHLKQLSHIIKEWVQN